MKIPGVVARHRAPVAVGAVVVGIAVVVFLVIRAGTSEEAKVPSPTSTTAKLSGAAAELVGLVERGRSVNVDVAYAGTTGNTPTPLTSHLWRRSPLVRLDLETGSGDAVVRSSQMVTSSGPFACTKEGTAPWSCAPKPGMEIADVGVVSPELVATLSALDVTARDDRVRDTDVRCFTVARPATASTVPGASSVATGELCLTSDGIAMRVEAGPTRFEAVSLNRGRPPDEVFRLPTSP